MVREPYWAGRARGYLPRLPVTPRVITRNSGGSQVASWEYGTNPHWYWDTTSLPYGTYPLEFCARSAGSVMDNDACYSAFGYKLQAAVTAVTVAAAPASPTVWKNNVVLTATATGGVLPVTYKFSVMNSQGTVVDTSPYTTTNTFSWATANVPPANYTVEVRASSAGSGIDNEAMQISSYQTYVPPPDNVALSASPTPPQTARPIVTFTATAAGGIAPYYYSFRIKNGGGSIIASSGSYSSGNSFQWDTAGLAAGSYTVEARAISTYTWTDAQSVLQTMTYVLQVPSVTGVTLTPTPASPQAPGTTVTFTAASTGGTAPLQYRFRIKNAGGTVIATRAYATTATYAWSTTGLASATYTTEVSAKSNGSTLDNEAVGTMSYPLVAPVSSVALSASPTSPRAKGTTITFRATASGGVTPYQYQFVIKNSGGTTVATRAYGTVNTYAWSSATAGTYTVEVDARSNGSNAAMETYKTISYKLN